jgi:hypothetical protein
MGVAPPLAAPRKRRPTQHQGNGRMGPRQTLARLVQARWRLTLALMCSS